MFTGDHLPLLHRRIYLRRQLRFVLWAVLFIAISLAIGIAGYMGFANMSFMDAFLNSSMILGGMGPVDPLTGNAAKWFASFYAIYCGVAMLSIVAAMLAPTIHRMLHRMHLEQMKSGHAEHPK